IEEYWGGDIQWFTPTEIKSNFVSESSRTITELGLKKSSAKILPKGTILLTTRATIGDVAIALNECSTNQGFQSLIVKENYDNLFLFNWIKQNKYELTKRANGSTFPEISKSEIEKIEVSFPNLSEQQKISSFLSLLDEKITSSMKTIEELNAFKKGIAKKIFSQQLKFKDDNGNDFSEWESKKLGKIATITTGSSNREDSILDGEYTFFDRSQDVRTSKRLLFDKEAVIVSGEGQDFIPKYCL